MIINWLKSLLARIPNPTFLLDEIWSGLLLLVTIVALLLCLLYIVFPILDSSLAPSPQL
jgi:hypothetical protein